MKRKEKKRKEKKRKEKKRQEKFTLFAINLMRRQLIYQAPQVQQVSVAVFCVGVKRKEPDRKETSMLFSDHDRSLLKGQPVSIVGQKINCLCVVQVSF